MPSRARAGLQGASIRSAGGHITAGAHARSSQFRANLSQEKVLVPVQRRDDIVAINNLGSQKALATRNAIKAAGARYFFLPANSPDLKPIEHIRAFARTNGVHALEFANLKHLLRKAAERSKDAVWQEIGSLLTSSLSMVRKLPQNLWIWFRVDPSYSNGLPRHPKRRPAKGRTIQDPRSPPPSPHSFPHIYDIPPHH